MLGWIAILILGVFLMCCGIADFASCRQIFQVTLNSYNTPKGTRKLTRPATQA